MIKRNLIKFLDNKIVNLIVRICTRIICFVALFLPLRILIYYTRPIGYFLEYVEELKNEK